MKKRPDIPASSLDAEFDTAVRYMGALPTVFYVQDFGQGVIQEVLHTTGNPHAQVKVLVKESGESGMAFEKRSHAAIQATVHLVSDLLARRNSPLIAFEGEMGPDSKLRALQEPKPGMPDILQAQCARDDWSEPRRARNVRNEWSKPRIDLFNVQSEPATPPVSVKAYFPPDQIRFVTRSVAGMAVNTPANRGTDFITRDPEAMRKFSAALAKYTEPEQWIELPLKGGAIAMCNKDWIADVNVSDNKLLITFGGLSSKDDIISFPVNDPERLRESVLKSLNRQNSPDASPVPVI